MEIADRIGKTAFNFNLIFSVIMTVIGLALLASGVDPGSQVEGAFLPLSWFYAKTHQLQSDFPSSPTSFDVTAPMILAGLLAVTLEFILMMLGGFLALVYLISSIIPEQLGFLVLPLYFIGAFIQLMVWIYAANMLVTKLSSLIPFGGGSSGSG